MHPEPARIDAVRLELIRNAMGSIVDEMLVTVVRIAYASIMKDSMDLSSAFCDRQGRMIAQGLAVPLHLGSFPEAMQAVMDRFGDSLAPGDIVILNDPYHGGMHLPDIFMFQPVFVDAHLLGYAVLVAHHGDVGGRVAGSSAADSTEIFQEGLRIPPVKLHSRGVADETLLAVIGLNVRAPEHALGDLRAQVAACGICERGMIALARRYGVAQLESCFDALLDYSERAARHAIGQLPDGVYRFTDHLDDDGVEMNRPIPICVALTVRGDELTVDLTGTAPQVRGAINATASFAKSAVYFAVRSIMETDVPNNAGFFRPIHVVTPEGSLINPRPPGAVAARGVTGFRLVDAVFGALAQACPGRVRAAGEGGTSSYSIGGHDDRGRYFAFREALMGAWGGGAGRDGIEGAANPAANIGNAPVEIIETQYPLRVDRYELVADSGGPGQWRGGLALEREFRFVGSAATLQLRTDRRDHRPYGLAGGGEGAPSNVRLGADGAWTQLPTKFVRPMQPGEAVRVTIPGAGGYGDARARDPRQVLEDVRDGKVTIEGAQRDYAVCLTRDPLAIDEAATAALRAAPGV
jgi:N-methylhydantoinase B